MGTTTQPQWLAWALLLVLLSHHALAQPRDATYTNQTQECFTQSIMSLLSVCSTAKPSTNLSQPISDAFSVFSNKCLGASYVSLKPIRILVPKDAPSLPSWRARAKQFEASTGIQVLFDMALSSLGSMELALEFTGTPVHAGFIFDPMVLGIAVGLGGLADLGPMLANSPNLNAGYIRFYRDLSARVRNKTMVMHLDGHQFLLYYRADLFKRYDLSPPQTWDDFLDIARLMNGTDTDGDGKPDLLGACFDVADNCKGSFLIPTVTSSYIQYLGQSQGFWFDPDTAPDLQPLVNNAAMAAALKFWQDLAPFTNRTRTCNAANADFQAGRCLMTINWGNEFKAIRRSNISKPGMFGVAYLPGTTRILDRGSNTLLLCDASRCPFSRPVFTRQQGNQQVDVNFAPYQAFGGWVAGVSATVSSDQQQSAFRFFSSLVAPEASWQDVLDPTSTVAPYRESHLRELDRWIAAGYDRQVTEQYLDAVQTSIMNPNLLIDIRLGFDPASTGYRTPFEVAFQNVTKPGAGLESIQPTMKVLHASLESLYQRTVMMVAAYMKEGPWVPAQQYWDMITITGSVLDLINARKPRPPPPPAPPPPVENKPPQTELFLAVGVPLVVLALVFVTAAVVYMHHLRKQQHRSLLGKVLAPGVGSDTTLVITDVQDSTTLFEVLPVSCVDKCMQLICGVIRDGIHKHDGYESATEGDSFIIAFHTASAAISFCVHLQEALLNVEWPGELFQAEGCDSVHPVWVSSTGDIAQTCQEMLVAHATPASKAKALNAAQTLSSWFRRIVNPNHQDSEQSVTPPAKQLQDSVAAAHPDLFSQLSFQPGGLAGELDCTGLEGPDDLSNSWQIQADGSRRASSTSTPRQHGRGKPVRGSSSLGKLVAKQSLESILNRSGSKLLSESAMSTHLLMNMNLKLLHLMSRAWSLEQDSQGSTFVSPKPGIDGAELMFRGPRVRCAVHSGLKSPHDVQYNKAAGRMNYSGAFLEAIKTVESCAHGGQILMSQDTFSLLDRTKLPAAVMLLHLGEHVVSSKEPSRPICVDPENGGFDAHGSRPTRSSSVAGVRRGTHLYTALHIKVAPRLPLWGGLKVQETMASGILDAPVSSVTIGFMQVVSMSDIKAWNAKEASTAMSIYTDIVKRQLQKAGGYLVEHVDGFVLVAFSNALSALKWAISVRQDMLEAPWSQQLLRYGLTEEVCVTQVDARGQQHKVLLLRGPRVKAGFDTGVTKSQVHATTGRMAYRGKVMNRAARIQAVATSTQVLCSAETWATAMAMAPSVEQSGLMQIPHDDVLLKGIKDKVTIYQVNSNAGIVNNSSETSSRSPRFFITQDSRKDQHLAA